MKSRCRWRSNIERMLKMDLVKFGGRESERKREGWIYREEWVLEVGKGIQGERVRQGISKG